MITNVDTAAGATSLVCALSADFTAGGRQLAQARVQQRDKDTPGHRAAVVEARDRIDAVLDMYLDLHQHDVPLQA